VAHLVTPLLKAYDTQLRGQLPDRLPEGMQVEQDGPLLRFAGMKNGGFIDYRDLGGSTAPISTS
jgi:hypothetical protein